MNHKELGTTGISIPEVGIGTWNYQAGPGPLRHGLEAGALFVDTAESYGTEEVVGQAIAGIRPSIFVATKVSPEHFRKADLIRSAETSLRKMKIEAIDLFQLHQPNPSIPIEEPLEAMTGLVDAGKVRFLGVSNFSVRQLREAQKASTKYPIASNQVRYSIIDRTIEKELLPYCQANKVTVIAYSPLGRGMDRIRDCDPEGIIGSIAQKIGKTAPQVVLNWCLCQEGVVVIPKGNSTAHILENCGASGWRLGEEELQELGAKIQFRQRTKLDALLRECTPHSVLKLGLNLLRFLPPGLRRRIT
ncbi:MAG TPA: aldo/keto reductase [Candidatus Solibacter sp.]|nr:aldo/keto reductase [Candidatus Solibacter sp.]